MGGRLQYTATYLVPPVSQVCGLREHDAPHEHLEQHLEHEQHSEADVEEVEHGDDCAVRLVALLRLLREGELYGEAEGAARDKGEERRGEGTGTGKGEERMERRGS